MKLFFFFVCLMVPPLLFGQAAELRFTYNQSSIIQLLNDSAWAKKTTENYLLALNDKYAHHQVEENTYLMKKIQSYIILNRNGNGLKITDSVLNTNAGLVFGVPYLTILHAYLAQGVKHNPEAYIPAVKAVLKKTGASGFDWYQLKNWLGTDAQGANSFVAFGTVNPDLLTRYFESRIHTFKKDGGSLNYTEMAALIRILAYIKIGRAVNRQQRLLIEEIAASQSDKHKNVIEQIDDTFTSVFPADEPGASIVLMRDNNILLQKGYGIADINTKKKIDVNTNFNIGSISKMFTATAILLLKQRNKLSLQDPIIKYLPDVNPKIGNKITIWNLLTHSSGLPRFVAAPNPAEDLIAMDRDTYTYNKNIDSLGFEPGTNFTYSNIGYRWLSLIVENITGMKFGDFVRQNILLPAGMQNSFELNRDMPIPNFAHAYKTNNKTFREYDYGEEPQFSTLGDGGLVSSTADFVAWEKALRANKVLPKDLFNESISPQISSANDLPGGWYGYGWFIEKDAAGNTIYSHSGGNGSFISYFFRVPSKNIMGAIFMNREDKAAIYDYVQSVLKGADWY